MTKPVDRQRLGLHHVAIRADDYDATLRFYVEGLGFRVRHTFSLPAAKIRQCAFLDSGDGSTYIELFEREVSAGSEVRPSQPGQEPVASSVLHFALRVADAGAAYERAVSAGARSQMPPRAVSIGEPPLALRFALVQSPNGETIEFFQSDEI